MTAPVKLYELADARAILDEWLAETEGEVTPELETLLNELAGATNEKIERVALYVREQLATADAIGAEAKRLTARAAAHTKAAEGLKAYLKRQMESLEVTKVTGLLATVALQPNPPAVTTPLELDALWAIEEARAFLVRDVVIKYTLDRAAVLAAWKAGAPLPVGIVVEQGCHLRIR